MADALAGLRVLELRQGIAAAYCGMLLSDLGADVVIAIDRVMAEDPDPPLAAQLYLDRNKRSVLLDPAAENGQQLLLALAGWSDVVVEELLPDTRARWRVDPDLWRRVRPDLIYASITPFGRTGPDADRPASDLIVQAVSGFMNITGFPEDPPTRSGTSLSEYYTGVATGVAVLAALRHRDRTGRGQLLDMALLDTLLTAMEGVPDTFFRTRELRPRTGNSNPLFPGYGFYEAKDGHVATAIQGVNIWPRFCIAIDRPELAERPEFTSQAGQDRWGAAVSAALIPWCLEHTRAEVVERLVAFGVPAAPVNTLADVIHEPPLADRGMLVEVDDPRRGRITITGSPLHLSETPGRVRRAAPAPGQDSRDVIAELRPGTAARAAAQSPV